MQRLLHATGNVVSGYSFLPALALARLLRIPGVSPCACAARVTNLSIPHIDALTVCVKRAGCVQGVEPVMGGIGRRSKVGSCIKHAQELRQHRQGRKSPCLATTGCVVRCIVLFRAPASIKIMHAPPPKLTLPSSSFLVRLRTPFLMQCPHLSSLPTPRPT